MDQYLWAPAAVMVDWTLRGRPSPIRVLELDQLEGFFPSTHNNGKNVCYVFAENVDLGTLQASLREEGITAHIEPPPEEEEPLDIDEDDDDYESVVYLNGVPLG